MTNIKFTVDVSGDNIDALVAAATREAEEFYKDLPGKARVKDISVSYDAEYYRHQVEAALKEAQELFDALSPEDQEDAEVVPAPVPRYSGWIEWEYDTNQKAPKKSATEIQAESGASVQTTTAVRPENDPKYQDAY